MKKIATFFIIGIGIASTSKILNGDYAFFNSRWPALVGMLVASYPLIELHAIIHFRKINRGLYPTHWTAWIVRAAAGIAIASLFHAFYWSWIQVITLALFSAGWCGIVFDYHLNRLRNKPRFYVGLPDKEKEGLIEKIFRRWKYGGQYLFILEILWMISCAYVYLK